jgi:hypothetical protein
MTDTNNAALDAAFEKAAETPLDGHYLDERFDRHENAELSTRQAADQVIKRRNQVGSEPDEIKLQDSDGSRTNGKASLRQSDTRAAAEHLAAYREDRNNLARELLSGSAESEQPTEEATAQAQQEQTEQAIREQVQAMSQAQAEQRLIEIERLRAAQIAHGQAIEQAKAAVAHMHNVEFQDIKTVADLHQLSQTDPDRHRRYLQVQDMYQQAAREHQKLEQGRQALAQNQQQQAQVQAQIWAIEQDEMFARRHPECRDPETMQRVKNQALEFLMNEQGYSYDEVIHRYNNDPSFREARNQERIYQAMQMSAATKKAKEVTSRAKYISPVQRPGVSRDRGWQDHEQIKALESRLGASGSVRDGARLLIERRRSQRG